MLHHSTIDAVRELPVEDVIGKYVDLKKNGIHYKACCPLHNEKTPSFVVKPLKNSFTCYGCGAGGDAIEFVMLHDSLPFIEAVKSIAGQHGIEIKEQANEKTPAQITEEQTMRKLMQQAHVTYRKLLFIDH